MRLRFRVTNTGKAPIALQLLGRVPTADFRISDSRDRIIWSRLRGETMLGALQLFPLEAGKELSFGETWNQRADNGRPVPPGKYLVRGVLLTDDPKGLASPAVRLHILP